MKKTRWDNFYAVSGANAVLGAPVNVRCKFYAVLGAPEIKHFFMLKNLLKIVLKILETSSHDQPLAALMTDKVREYLQHQKQLLEEGKAAQAQGAKPPKEQPTMSQEEIEGVKMIFKKINREEIYID